MILFYGIYNVLEELFILIKRVVKRATAVNFGNTVLLKLALQRVFFSK